MKVVFDLLGVQNRDHGERGIARYVTNLALAIEAEFPNLVDHYLVHSDLPIPGSMNPILASGKAIRADDLTNPALSPTSGGVFLCGSLFELEQPMSRVLPTWARSPHWRRAVVLYDLIPLRFSSQYLADRSLRLRYETRVQALKMFDHLLSISQASADDAVELAEIDPSKVSSIGAGADPQFRLPSGSQAAATDRVVNGGRFPGLRSGYVLFPTGFDFRKNIDGFVRAYAALSPNLRQKHQLVMMCGLNGAQEAFMGELMAEVGLGREDLILTGRVSDSDLVVLNQGAHLVVFPSLYEGFGLPVLEARQCGAAVLCGDNSSLREIQPDPRARFDASSVASMTGAMSATLGAPGEVERLRNMPIPQFSWPDSAIGSAGVIEQLSKSVDPAPLPRLGIISPLPPQQSGIATYTTRLVEHLQHYADITVFVEPDESGQALPLAPSGVEVLPLRQLSATIEGGGAFDELLYFMGNSRFHVGAFGALKSHPGVVLFHDVRMSGLYNESVRLGRNGIDSVGSKLATMYPNRYRPSLEAATVISPSDAARFGLLMCAEIAQTATKVLTHSRYAATLLALDAGVEAEVCFPLPAPAIDPPSSDAVDLIISSFGVVDPAKKPEAVIEAVADVRRLQPNVHLNFVGPIDPAYERDLTGLIKSLDLGSVVSFSGHLDDVDFSAAQRSTNIAVQLRAQSNGESSAAVAELLAAGIPTVVSDLGAMSDLDDTTVVKVSALNTAGELARVLLDLAREPQRRQQLSVNAQAWAHENSFERAAEKLAQNLFG